jgi:hypothetical protein
LLARLTVPDAYAIEEVGESIYRLVVSTDDGAVSAASAPVEHDKAVAMREALRALAAQDGALPHRLKETRSEYHCRLTDSRGETLIESVQGSSAEIWATMDGLERAAQRDEAIHRTRDAFSKLDDPPQFHTEQIDGDYYFRFDLDGGTVLRSRWSYESEEAAAEAAKDFLGVPAVDDNYRTRDLGLRNFGLEILDKKRAEANREKACEACNRLVEAAQDPDAFRLVTDAERCAHGFELIDADGETLARHRRLFANEKEREDTIRAIQCLAGAEGFHLVEHLLLRPKQTEEPRDALIPLGGGCRDADGNICPAGADPYSFRVTVVVPYWPRRFRHTDFRPFFERTLRLETPAHILPRICWVDVCQMQAFEDAYRRWLQALASPGDDCDRASAQNELVELLFSLKSLYGTARLFGCTGDGVTNPLRLDQTILGTAGTDHGDFS